MANSLHIDPERVNASWRGNEAGITVEANRVLRGPGLPDGPLPVFDRGRHVPIERSKRDPIEFTRTDRDRRPGTPLPPEATGDPHPDRLARAEALRELLLRNDARHKIEGSVDRVDLLTIGGKDTVGRARVQRGQSSSTPDIETPRTTYLPVPPELAKLEARRGDKVLLFATASAAARCITGEMSPKWEKAIYNAAGGITKSAFGWEWIRLKARRGKAL